MKIAEISSLRASRNIKTVQLVYENVGELCLILLGHGHNIFKI